MSLQKLVEEVKKQKAYANDDLSNATPQTRIPREGRKRAAQMRLEELFFQYRNEIRSRILAILVTGDGADEFGAIAKNSDAKLDSIEGDLLYSSLSEELDERLLGASGSASVVLDVASRYLEDVALEIGVKEYNQLIYKSKYQSVVKNREDAKKLIREAVLEQIGAEMNALTVLSVAANIAYNENFDGKLFPIMVKARNEENLQELRNALSSMGSKAIVISTGSSKVEDSIKVKEVDEESVLEALKKVKQKASKGQ